MPISYPRPVAPTRHTPIADRRDIRTIRTTSPPLPAVLPPLPTSPRAPEFLKDFSVTTHLVPAAYPRLSYREPLQYAETRGEGPHFVSHAEMQAPPGEDRKAWAARQSELLMWRRDEIRRLRQAGAPTVPDGQEDDGPLLWHAVNRYARVSAPRNPGNIGLTLFAAHANGMHKEVILLLGVILGKES